MAVVSTNAPPKVTVPAPLKVRTEVPGVLFRTTWSPATPAVVRLERVLLWPLSSSVAALPTLPRTTLVEFAQAAAEPTTKVPFSTRVTPE